MDVKSWLDILQKYRSYGINCMRFHSHCPPEEAFYAADQIGMLMQPELSYWNPRDAFESEESFSYYKTEMVRIIEQLANHPSFVMLTWGNELHASSKGHERMTELLELARKIDSTRLYANGSNVHYGKMGCDENSDFYTADSYYQEDLREIHSNRGGYINRDYPNTIHTYDVAMQKLRAEYKKPVFGFEVGQFEVLPDFSELKEFVGISEPFNLCLIKERVQEKGLLDVWEKYVEATGELSRIGYREEIEAVLRTVGMSGLSLLGMQDFPGQGTAPVGMMNSHLQQKPCDFAKPEKFRSFFTDQLPLVMLPKYTWINTETLTAKIQIVNYGKKELHGNLKWKLLKENENESKQEGILQEVHCPIGQLTDEERFGFRNRVSEKLRN